MHILDTIFIFPLRFLMSIVLDGGAALTGSVGAGILILSIVVNTVLLPLYYLAEKWQNRERAVQKAMAPGLAELKKSYKGEERYNHTVKLYKTFQYHPVMSLRTSFGFLIQVPFFIAAYTLLSHNPLLEGVSFLFLSNLGAVDGMLNFGFLTVNLMPILMTLFNLVSSFFYTRSFSRGEKMKLLFIALVFLVLLYNSSSGLVLYWTLNNLYSLIKNLVHNPVNIGEGIS
ncbi:MAG: membrane protein insertase YidC [Spirochaetaceae bacterium]|nr:membrane protein insertase YidC [Spirochaetaceae bacterium]